jgi:hypothetical protein
MSDAKQHAESAFTRNQKRDSEIDNAPKAEQAHHAAGVKNMHRLRVLRLARNAASSGNDVGRADTPKSSEGRHAQARVRPTTKA